MGVAGRERYACPCCGYLTATEPGGYDICPICGWEDDPSQLRFAGMTGGANKPSLVDAQRDFEATGASDPDALRLGRIHVRPPGPTDRRDEGWRPIRDDEVERGEPGVDQGRNYPSSYEQLYYWRPTFWRSAPSNGIDRTVMSFSFGLIEGRIGHADKLALNEEFPEDAVIADVDRQMVQINRVSSSAAAALTDIEARLRRALPGRRFAAPSIGALRGDSGSDLPG